MNRLAARHGRAASRARSSRGAAQIVQPGLLGALQQIHRGGVGGSMNVDLSDRRARDR